MSFSYIFFFRTKPLSALIDSPTHFDIITFCFPHETFSLLQLYSVGKYAHLKKKTYIRSISPIREMGVHIRSQLYSHNLYF